MIFEGQLSYHIWLSLPLEIRHKLVRLFNMPHSGNTVVEYRPTGPIVTSDGYTPEDLKVISLLKMRELLRSDSDNFYKLFEEVITKLDSLLGDTTVVPLGNNTFPGPTAGAPIFCTTCTSRGGRHLKVCPKFK